MTKKRHEITRNRVSIVCFPIRGFLQPGKDVNFVSHKRKLTILERILIKLPMLQKMVHPDISGWEYRIEDGETIILFDAIRNYSDLASLIEQTHPHSRLILYLWNPVSYSDDYKKISERWERWTFSKEDSINFKFKYAGTFYDMSTVKQFAEAPITKDVFFIGTEKGRKTDIDEMKRHLGKYLEKIDIRIADNTKCWYDNRYTRYLSYMENCKEIASTRILMEVVQKGQTGLTLRSMECIFWGKKLVTNNKSILDSEIYHPNNIFVVGHNKWDEFISFIDNSYIPIESKILKKYYFESWIDRLLCDEELDCS